LTKQHTCSTFLSRVDGRINYVLIKRTTH